MSLRGLARLGVTIDRTPDEAAILTLARRHRLTVYEAELSRPGTARKGSCSRHSIRISSMRRVARGCD